MADDVRARLAELEGLDEDLFDFPDVHGMSDLIAASRESAAAGDAPPARTAQPTSQSTPPSSPPSGAGPKPVTAAAPKPAGEPRGPLPSAPIAAGDLDEDLFGFGELLDLGASAGFGTEDPTLDPDPLADLAAEPWAVQPEPKPAEPPKASALDAKVAPATPGPQAAPPVAPPAKSERAEPQRSNEASGSEDSGSQRERKAKNKKSAAKPTVVMREKKSSEPAAAAPPAASKERATHQAGSPLLAFPDAIDLPPARSKMLWVLVGCFLLVNGMIFLITQQQSHSVNKTLAAVTSTLADAIARGGQPQPTAHSEGRAPEVALTPATERPAGLDPATYSNTHEVALESARRLIQAGEYTRARRNLFTVLANQDRGTPLTQALREEIDYLIALTYYDQGLSIATEERK